MGAYAGQLAEADLHGLVDGHLDAGRRADVLRRLAASPADRALVESWQEQNDLIRASFGDVAREILPVTLDLAPPRLRCVDVDASGPIAALASGNRNRAGTTLLATALVVAIGLAGSWLLIDQASRGYIPADARLRGSLDATLADRAATAIDAGVAGEIQRSAGLPTTRIPDLSAAGFVLTGATTEPTAPASIVFRYRDATNRQVAISVGRAPRGSVTSAPTLIGNSYTWHRRDAAYALAGTLPSARLREIAVALQSDDGDE